MIILLLHQHCINVIQEEKKLAVRSHCMNDLVDLFALCVCEHACLCICFQQWVSLGFQN